MFRNKSNLLKCFWVCFKSCWIQFGSVILVWRKLFLEGVHDLRSTIIYLDLVEPILNSKLLHPCNWNWVGSVQKRYNTPKQFSIPDQHDSKFLFEKCLWWFSIFHFYFHLVQRLFIWSNVFRVGSPLSLALVIHYHKMMNCRTTKVFEWRLL